MGLYNANKPSVFTDRPVDNSKLSRKMQDGIVKEYWDTNFKYKDIFEKNLVSRFLKWHRNRYIAYAGCNSNMEFAAKDGSHFFLATEQLRQRFNELYPFSFIVVDKQFLDNNYLPKEYDKVKRYIYCIDEETYNKEVKTTHKPRSIASITYPGVRLVKSYECLLEMFEEKLDHQNILLIGKEPWEKLRYFVDQIEITYSDEFPTFEDNTDKLFPLNKFQSFLGFTTINEFQQTLVKEVKNNEVADKPELFSDYIKFNYSSKERKEIETAKSKNITIKERYKYLVINKSSQA